MPENCNVVILLESQVKQRAEQVAICESTGSVTFAELAQKSAQGANYLQSLGLKKGDAVLVFVPMSRELYIILMALWRVGLVAVFMDPSSGRKRLQDCCDVIRPQAFIGIPKAQILRLLTPALRRIPLSFSTGPTLLSKPWSASAKFTADDNIADCDYDHPALITFTSGSTGKPKGTVRTHGFLQTQSKVLQKCLRLEAGEADLATLPVFALINLACGVTTIIPSADISSPGKIKAEPVMRQLSKNPVQTCVASPAFFARLISAEHLQPLQSLRRIFTGGAPVFPALLRELHDKLPQTDIVAVYGSTEAEPIAEIAFTEILPEDWQKMADGDGLLTGRPVHEIDCCIIQNQWGTPLMPLTAGEFKNNLLPAGQVGEIVVHGDHVLKGYLNDYGNDENKFQVDSEVWHRTGDAGYFDDQGRLWLMGRCSAVITDTQGKIYPFAVETACREIPAIDKVALCQFEGRRILIAETKLSQADLASQLDFILTKFKIEHILISEIPMDKRHNAKVDYPALLHKLSISKLKV